MSHKQAASDRCKKITSINKSAHKTTNFALEDDFRPYKSSFRSTCFPLTPE